LKESKHNLIVSQAGGVGKTLSGPLFFLLSFEVTMFSPASFFALDDFEHAAIFQNTVYVWEALKNLKAYIQGLGNEPLHHACLQDGIPLPCHLIFHEGLLRKAEDCCITWGDATKGEVRVACAGQDLPGASVIMAGAVVMGTGIHLGKGILIESGALVKGPTVLGDYTEVRQGAYLRGYCLTGKRCVIGHTTEVKHSIFLNDAKAGHFAYLGDSILGNATNLGAGTKFANLRFLPGTVPVRTPERLLDSGLRKFGAILGDRTQTGCNSVTNPGTVLGQDSLLLPNTTAPSGYHPPKSMLR
jgi:hypothetical protein